MLIDNRKDRYPNSGLNIKTVWDFINMYSGNQSGHTGKLDIVTGYFTIRALSKLYRDIPEEVFNMTLEDYSSFLDQRRLLMAQKIRKYYENL